jgi:hypothetical protein
MFSVLHPITDLGTAERIVAVWPLTAAPPLYLKGQFKFEFNKLFAVGPNLEKGELCKGKDRDQSPPRSPILIGDLAPCRGGVWRIKAHYRWAMTP